MLLIDLAPLLQNPGSILSFEIHGCLCLPLNPNANNFVVEASTKNEDCWTETDLYKTWCCWGRAQLSIYVACSWSGLSFIMDSVLMCWKTVRYFRCCFQNFMLTISVLIFRMCHSYCHTWCFPWFHLPGRHICTILCCMLYYVLVMLCAYYWDSWEEGMSLVNENNTYFTAFEVKSTTNENLWVAPYSPSQFWRWI